MKTSVNEPAAGPGDASRATEDRRYKQAIITPPKPSIAPTKAKSTEQAESVTDCRRFPKWSRRRRQPLISVQLTEPFFAPDTGRVQ